MHNLRRSNPFRLQGHHQTGTSIEKTTMRMVLGFCITFRLVGNCTFLKKKTALTLFGFDIHFLCVLDGEFEIVIFLYFIRVFPQLRVEK